LLAAGASPSSVTNTDQGETGASPLSLVLHQAAPVSSVTKDNTGSPEFHVSRHSDRNGSQSLGISANGIDNSTITTESSNSSRRMWLKVSDILVKAGATWDSTARFSFHRSQLHVMLSALPVLSEDWMTFVHLVRSAIRGGLSVLDEDDRGCNALFILCDRLANISRGACVDASRLVQVLLEAARDASGTGRAASLVLAADRTGRTILDIEDKMSGTSAFSAVRHLLEQTKGSGTTSTLYAVTGRSADADNTIDCSTKISRGYLQSDDNNDWVLYDDRQEHDTSSNAVLDKEYKSLRYSSGVGVSSSRSNRSNQSVEAAADLRRSSNKYDRVKDSDSDRSKSKTYENQYKSISKQNTMNDPKTPPPRQVYM